MKDIIEMLLKKYYKITMILPVTKVQRDMGKEHVTIHDDLAPNLWMLYDQTTINQSTGRGKVDIDRAKIIQEDERKRIAIQIYNLTTTILKQKNKDREWDAEYNDVPPTLNDEHEKLIRYSTGALFYMDIITPYEYDITEPLHDESGNLLAMKQLPKEMDEDEIMMQNANK